MVVAFVITTLIFVVVFVFVFLFLLALKFIPDELANDAQALSRFQREAIISGVRAGNSKSGCYNERGHVIPNIGALLLSGGTEGRGIRYLLRSGSP